MTQKTDKELKTHPDLPKLKVEPLSFCLLFSIRQRMGIPFARAKVMTDTPIKTSYTDSDTRKSKEKMPQTPMDKNRAFLGTVSVSTESISIQYSRKGKPLSLAKAKVVREAAVNAAMA